MLCRSRHRETSYPTSILRSRSSRGLRNHWITKSLSFVSVAGNHGPKQQCDSNIFQVHVQPKMPWIDPENNVQFNLRLGITVRRCSIFECFNIFHCLFFVCSGSNKLFGWQWLFVKVTDDPIGTCRNWSAKPQRHFRMHWHAFRSAIGLL